VSDKTATVKVFGSAVIKVEPDVVSLHFGVSRKANQPKDAFNATHQAARDVRAYLSKAGVKDVAESRVTLSQLTEYTGGKHVPAGYQSRVTFNVLLTDLGRMEELLVGVVGAGANEIGSVQFRTTALKAHRTAARQRAVAAAREKAELYCRAAGVGLGAVVSIEDGNPNALRGTGEQNVSDETPAEDAGPDRALSPASIIVGASVTMVFALAPGGQPTP
jgi:uncharacterized protein YggE